MLGTTRPYLVPPLLALAVAAGCATQGHTQADKTAHQMDALHAAVQDLQAKVSVASAALAAVVDRKDRDPEPAFQQFAADVDALAGAQKRADSRLEGVRKDAEKYFVTWKEQAATITDPVLQKRSEERREALSSAVEKVNKAMEPARAEVTTYLVALQDAVKYLSIDLTPPGIAGAKGKANSAAETSKSANKSLSEVLRAVEAARPLFTTPKPEVAETKQK